MIDVPSRQVTRGGSYVHLTDLEWRLLRELALHVDKVVPHRELLRRVWGPGCEDAVECLRTVIKQLRRLLEPDPAQPRYIITEARVGYRLAELLEDAPERFDALQEAGRQIA